MRAENALERLHVHAGSSETLLITDVVSIYQHTLSYGCDFSVLAPDCVNCLDVTTSVTYKSQ